MPLPYKCPLDHVFDMENLHKRVPKFPGIREYTFLNKIEAKEYIKDSWVVLTSQENEDNDEKIIKVN